MAIDYSWCKFPKNRNIKVIPVEVTITEKKKLKTNTKLKTKRPLKKSDKPIKKKSDHKEEVTEETYNAVFERDKGRCRLCGNAVGISLHHIMGRGKDLTNNIDNCIMLCDEFQINRCHKVVHTNLKKYRPILKNIIKNKGEE